MTKRLLLLAFALLLIPALPGCDSSDDDNGGNNGDPCNNGTMTATAAGSSFTAECVVIDISNGLLTISGVANIDGSSGSSQQTITLGGIQAMTGTQTPTVATYADISDPSDPTSGLTCASSALPGVPAPSVTINAIDDDSASGSFSFTALCPSDGSQISVTSGRFDISE